MAFHLLPGELLICQSVRMAKNAWLGMSRLSANRKGNRQTGPYACGEDLPTHMIQPDYGQFLPFAFFFTILHVTALMVTTAAGATAAALAIALLYVLGAAVGLLVLYRN